MCPVCSFDIGGSILKFSDGHYYCLALLFRISGEHFLWGPSTQIPELLSACSSFYITLIALVVTAEEAVRSNT